MRDHPPKGAFLTVAGRRLHYLQRGTGPDIVLLHGASGNLAEFDFGLIAALAKDWRVTAFDRPGLGHSPPLPGASLEAQARLLRQACAELGVKAPVLVGQSYGGSVALAWALQEPPRALVQLGAPCLPWPGDLDIWYRLNRNPLLRAVLLPLAAAWIWRGYVENSLTGIFAPNPVPPDYAMGFGVPLTLRFSALKANVLQVLALRAELVAMEPFYPRLNLPIELVHGVDDAVVPLMVHSGPLSARLPNARLTALPGIGHMPHHAALPEVLAAIERAALRAPLQSP